MAEYKLNDSNETVIWHGKKALATSILDALTNHWILLSMIVFLADALVFTGILLKTGPKSAAGYMLRLAWLHYLPLFIYLLGIAYSVIQSATTHYIVTNKYVYIQYGIFRKTSISNDVDDIEYVSLHRNFFDRLLHTGDITVFTCDEVEKNGKLVPEEKYLQFENIKNETAVYELIGQIRNRTCPINDPGLIETLRSRYGN